MLSNLTPEQENQTIELISNLLGIEKETLVTYFKDHGMNHFLKSPYTFTTDEIIIKKIEGINALRKLMSVATIERKININSPESVYNRLINYSDKRNKEYFVALFLDTKNNVIKEEVINVGTRTASLVDANDIVKKALVYDAKGVIVAHNHPSGDPTPSPEDIQVTKRLFHALKLIDVSLHDSIVVGEKYYSMKQETSIFNDLDRENILKESTYDFVDKYPEFSVEKNTLPYGPYGKDSHVIEMTTEKNGEGQIIFIGDYEKCGEYFVKLRSKSLSPDDLRSVWLDTLKLDPEIIKSVAQLDFVNTDLRNMLQSEQMQNINILMEKKSLDVEVADTYYKQWDVLNTADTFVPKLAIFQKRMSAESEYELIYSEHLDNSQIPSLEDIFHRFNADELRPSNYYGTSVSVDDIIVIGEDDLSLKAFKVDSVGFSEHPEFLTLDKLKRVYVGFDVRKEFELLGKVRELQGIVKGEVLSNEHLKRVHRLEKDYKNIFKAADIRAVLLDEASLTKVYEYEHSPYFMWAASDRLTEFNEMFKRPMFKDDALKNASASKLSKMLLMRTEDSPKSMAFSDVEMLKVLREGDHVFLYNLSNGVNIDRYQYLENKSCFGFDSSTGEQINFTHKDIESVRRDGVMIERSEFVKPSKSLSITKEQRRGLFRLYSAVLAVEKYPNDEVIQAESSARFKHLADELDGLGISFSVQNAVAAAARDKRNWDLYNDKLLDTVFERLNITSGKEDIDLNSTGVKLEGHKGTWYTISSETIQGKMYFLLESETHGDEAAAIIVDASGKIVLQDVWNGFDDLRDHLEELKNDKMPQYYVIKDISTWSNLNNANLVDKIEMFDSLDDALSKFLAYKGEISEFNDSSARTVLGVSLGISDCDVVQVRNNMNYFCYDFMGSNTLKSNSVFLADLLKISDAVKFERMNIYHDIEGRFLKKPLDIPFEDWDKTTVYFKKNQAFEQTKNVRTDAAVTSNFEGYVVLSQEGVGVYLGKTSNYDGQGNYNNFDDSLVFVSKNPNMFSFLSSDGWVTSQQEMIDKGHFTESDYSDYAWLREGVLKRFKRLREIQFSMDINVPNSGVPFAYPDWEQNDLNSEKGRDEMHDDLNSENSEIDDLDAPTEVDVIYDRFLDEFYGLSVGKPLDVRIGKDRYKIEILNKADPANEIYSDYNVYKNDQLILSEGGENDATSIIERAYNVYYGFSIEEPTKPQHKSYKVEGVSLDNWGRGLSSELSMLGKNQPIDVYIGNTVYEVLLARDEDRERYEDARYSISKDGRMIQENINDSAVLSYLGHAYENHIDMKGFSHDGMFYFAKFNHMDKSYSKLVIEQGDNHYVTTGSAVGKDLIKHSLTEEQVLAYRKFIEDVNNEKPIFRSGALSEKPTDSDKLTVDEIAVLMDNNVPLVFCNLSATHSSEPNILEHTYTPLANAPTDLEMFETYNQIIMIHPLYGDDELQKANQILSDLRASKSPVASMIESSGYVSDYSPSLTVEQTRHLMAHNIPMVECNTDPDYHGTYKGEFHYSLLRAVPSDSHDRFRAALMIHPMLKGEELEKAKSLLAEFSEKEIPMNNQSVVNESPHGEEVNTVENPAMSETEKADLSAKDKLMETLKNGIYETMESDAFKNYLKTSSRLFYNNYSFRNVLLTFFQKPTASYVMGYEAWKEVGRQVNKGAKSIQIVTPAFAKEYTKGGLYKSIKSKLQEQLNKDKSLPFASYRLGTSKLTFTMTHNGIFGLTVDGKSQMFSSDEEFKKFIDRNVLGKVPLYYGVANVFDYADTSVPEHVWLKTGFNKEDLELDPKNNPIVNKRGEFKVKNTPERQAKFVKELDMSIAARDADKMNLLFSILQKVSADTGVPMMLGETKEGVGGYYQRASETEGAKIVVNENLDPTQRVSVGFHELTHSMLHTKENLQVLKEEIGEVVDRQFREVQAEAVAFTTAQKFGIDTETSSFNYLAVWSSGKEVKELEKSIDAIYRESKALYKAIGKELEARGYDLNLESLDKTSLSNEVKEPTSKRYTELVLGMTEKYGYIKKDITAEIEIVDTKEELRIVKEQVNAVAAIENVLYDIANNVAKFDKCTDLKEQQLILAELEAFERKLTSIETVFDALTQERVAVVEEIKNSDFKQFFVDPLAMIKKVQSENEKLKTLTDNEITYLSKSSYVRDHANLLKTGTQPFAELLVKRIEDVRAVASKNGSFVEVNFCEQWGENVIVEKGALCHPKALNKVIENGEMEVRRLKVEADTRGEYYPYHRLSLNLFTVKDGEMLAYKARVDVGDTCQKNLKDYVENHCPQSLSGIVEAVGERNSKKVQIIVPEPVQKQVEKNERITKSAAEWKESIQSERSSQNDSSEQAVEVEVVHKSCDDHERA